MSSLPLSDQDRIRIRDLLGKTDLFGCLTESDRWALSEHIQVRTYVKDELLFDAGDPADSLFVIEQGRVTPKDFTFRFTSQSGDVIGEVWLFASDDDVRLRHSGAQVETDNTVVLHVPFVALEPFKANAAFLLRLVQRHQRYTHWSLQERAIDPRRAAGEVAG